MNFIEAFFSTEKLIYPIIGAILFSIVMLIISELLTITVTDKLLYLFIILGFLIGNLVKIQKIIN